MSPLNFWTPGRSAPIGRCTCGATVYPDGFRSRESRDDFSIAGAGLCQSCRDRTYFAVSTDGTLRYPIRRGVLAAPEVRDGAVAEIGLLPFIFVAPECRVAWEARHLLRAGPDLDPLNVWDGPAEPPLRLVAADGDGAVPSFVVF